MTVTYSYEASTASFLGIHRLLLHWRASVWKAVWPELLLWCVCYTIISVCYRCAMNEHQQHTFERICNYAYGYSDYLPLSLILSFFVNTVYTRFTKFFDNLAFIDSPGLLVCASIKGTDETARNIRRNIVRYMVLMQALVMRKISSNIKRRFPTMDHLVTAGLMTENELKEFDSLVSPQMKYWVPIHWAFSLCRKARALGMIDSDFILIDVLDKIRGFRQPTLTLILLDWVPIPLVYTQVVNLTVRIFFILALLGRQYLLHGDTPNAKVIDLYVPIISIIQFVLYIGWVKVAEVLLNPFGDDDDDFELNWVIDRNLQVGLLIADSYDRYPKLERDAFWNDVLPEPLYTAESDRPQNPMVGSVAELNVSPQKRKISDYFMPPKWRSEQNISNDDEVNVIEKKPKKYMSTNTFSAEELKFSDPKQVPVLRLSQNRRLNAPSPEIRKDDPWRNAHLMQKISTNLKQIKGQKYKNDLSVASLPTIESYVDGIPPVGQRKFSEVTTVDPVALNALLQHLAKVDTDSTGEPDMARNAKSFTSGTWKVNEMLPVIEEEESRRRMHSTNSSTAQNSTIFTTIKSSPQMTLNDNFHDKKSSLEHDGKYDGLLKLASPTSTSSTAPVSDVPKETQEQYINFGYSEDEWEKEHSAPNNLAMMATTPKVQMFDGQMEPPPTRVASQPTPLTPDEHDRPRFRLSISSQGSNEHTPPSKSR